MGCVANWGRFGSICIELSSRQVVTGSFSSNASKIGRRFKMFRGRSRDYFDSTKG